MTYFKFFQATLLSASIFIMGSTPSVAMEDENKTFSSIPPKQIQAPTSSSSSNVQPDVSEDGDDTLVSSMGALSIDTNDVGAEASISAPAPASSSSSSSSSNVQPDIHEYNSVVEYQRHQYASNRFFRKVTRKPILREAIEVFKQQVIGDNPLTSINLDGFSSRTRVLLFRELTAHSLAQHRSIPFVFHGKEFRINLQQSLRQPGDGIIDTIGTHGDIFGVLDIYTSEYQKLISEKLMSARHSKPLYHPAIPYPSLSKEAQSIDLEILNILLDFEVARRLQGTQGEEQEVVQRLQGTPSEQHAFDFLQRIIQNRIANINKVAGLPTKKIDYMEGDKLLHDRVPVASAIVGLLSLSRQENPIPLKTFFHAPETTYAPDGSEFPHGDFNAFQGAPMEGHRALATKRIIKELRGGENAQNSSREDIHQEYLDTFGGNSESDGENYGDSSGEDD